METIGCRRKYRHIDVEYNVDIRHRQKCRHINVDYKVQSNHRQKCRLALCNLSLLF